MPWPVRGASLSVYLHPTLILDPQAFWNPSDSWFDGVLVSERLLLFGLVPAAFTSRHAAPPSGRPGAIQLPLPPNSWLVQCQVFPASWWFCSLVNLSFFLLQVAMRGFPLSTQNSAPRPRPWLPSHLLCPLVPRSPWTWAAAPVGPHCTTR